MKRRILALAVSIVFVLGVFQYGAFAASSVDGTAGTEKIYDTVDATPEANGYRLSLNSYWQVANFPEADLNKLNATAAPSAEPYAFAPMTVDDLNTFTSQATIPWKAVLAPSDLNSNADFAEAHRVFYHAKIKVSQADIDAKRSFYFDFVGTNWIATVFVNGQFAGSKKSCRLPWKLDVTNKVVVGDNDIYIGMKAPRYAIDPIGTSSMSGSFGARRKLSNYFTSDFKWYLAAGSSPDGTSTKFGNINLLKWYAPITPSEKGGTANYIFGLTDNLYFVATGGSVYVQDAYVKTNVVNTPNPSASPNPATDWKVSATSKTLSAEVTLFNSSAVSQTVDVNITADLVGGAVEKTFDPQNVTISANSSKVIYLTDVQWADAKLWSPNLNKAEAPLYKFDVKIVKSAATIDTFKQEFGFRDIKLDGKNIRVNGVRRNFRQFGGAGNGSTTGQEIVDNMKSVNSNYERLFLVDLSNLKNDAGKENLTLEEQTSVFDTYGIPNTFCSTIDGMMASFNVIKNGAVNQIMFENFRDTIAQMVQTYRNHPSIISWSLENEFLFINCANIWGNYLPIIETAVHDYMYAPAYANDSTRIVYTDGGAAGQKNQEKIFASHYHESTNITTPSSPLSAMGPTHGGWVYNDKKPYFAAEVLFFSTPFSFHNWVGGETAANNQKEALTAYSKYLRYMIDRYRWNDAALISSVTYAKTIDINEAMQALDIITKDYKTTLLASKGYYNDVKLINDTTNTAPITFKWTLSIDGVVKQTASEIVNIEPGFSTIKSIKITPITGITKRTKGILKYEMIQAGSTTGEKIVELGIFPTPAKIKITKKVYTYNASKDVVAAIKSLGIYSLAVPKTMKIVASTKKIKYYAVVKGKLVTKYRIVKTYKTVTLMSGSNLKNFIKTPTSILVVGNSGLKTMFGEGGDSDAIVNFAKAGGRVVTLEQSYNNMIYSGLEPGNWPNEIYKFSDASNNEWNPSLNFGQGFDKPILKGLAQSDLSFWGGGGNTAATAWGNISGAKNWVSAGPGSKATTLFELPVVKGMLTATQLRVGNRITIEPVAKVLLGNMIKNADSYAPPANTVGILSSENPDLTSIVNSTNVKYIKVPSITAGLNVKTTKIFIVQASLANLNTLNTNKTLYNAYTNAGGWVILWGLAPDGLAAYNTLLGTQHVIRPFRKEATASISDGTSIGLSTSDYMLYDTKIIAPWINLAEVSRDTYSYAVDATDEIAAFHDFEAMGHGNNWPLTSNMDGNKASMTNSLYNGDFWHYIWQVWVAGSPAWDQRNTPGATPPPLDLFTFKLPKSEKINKVVFFNNKNYNAFKGCTITALADNGTTVLDSKTENLLNSFGSTDFNFSSVQTKTINIKISSYYDNKGSVPMCGVDELQIFRDTPQWKIDSKCMALNSSGTIVKYARGSGGVLLNNVKLSGFQALEPDTNLELKAKIFTVFFQNFGAKFK